MPVSSREEEKHLIERLLNLFSDNNSGAPTHKVTEVVVLVSRYVTMLLTLLEWQ